MRQYFYKAKSLIVIFVAIAMLFTLGGMAYVNNREKQRLLPWLSEHYSVISLTQNDEEKPLLDKQKLIKSLSHEEKDYLLMKQYVMTNVYAVYDTTGKLFQLKLKEGRGFTRKDYMTGSNTAVISSLSEKDCVKRDGSLWWEHQQKWYRVIGIYDGKGKYGDEISSNYINLTSQNLSEDVLDGTYVYDTNFKTEEHVKRFSEKIMKRYPGVVLDSSVYGDSSSQELSNKGTNFNAMFLLLLMTAFLVLLNSFTVCQNWIQARKKEIGVRRMVGAEKADIYRWILKTYFVLMAGSFVGGVLCVRIFLKTASNLPVAHSVQMMFGDKISGMSIVLGFGMVSVLSILVLLITLSQYYKKEIVGNL